jgi:hypothetical protein
MRNSGNLGRSLKKRTVVSVMVITTVTLNNVAIGMPGYGRAKTINGPWELLVQMGSEGQGLRFPIKVDDENKWQKLADVLPVLGTPIKIRLAQYLPDLKWDTSAVEDPNGGIVAKLALKGEDLEQDIWLSSDDPAKQSVSSRIGWVKLKELNDAEGIEKLLREITDPNVVGIVTVWPDDTNSPSEFAVSRSETIAVPKSKYRVKVLDYLPHYSIDAETKKIINRSDKPVNPAIKVSVSDGENTHEQWLWSKFPSYPHTDKQLPLRIQFAYFDLNMTEGGYIFVTARGAEPWLFFAREGKTQLEKAILGRPYPFANEDYSFTIEQVFDSAIIKTDWKNDSEELRNPAIIATIEQNDTEQEVVLELHKPFHHKTTSGTMVLVYRPAVDNFKTSN